MQAIEKEESKSATSECSVFGTHSHSSKQLGPFISFLFSSLSNCSIIFAPQNLSIHIGVGSGVDETDEFDSLITKMPLHLTIDYLLLVCLHTTTPYIVCNVPKFTVLLTGNLINKSE